MSKNLTPSGRVVRDARIHQLLCQRGAEDDAMILPRRHLRGRWPWLLLKLASCLSQASQLKSQARLAGHTQVMVWQLPKHPRSSLNSSNRLLRCTSASSRCQCNIANPLLPNPSRQPCPPV